ncbi:MAG: GGDEF domain-containing protein [Deltaproteobacteria bacterium]|nr:GGDEF domain-containing protein [Deltaproteobacteria bacterium]
MSDINEKTTVLAIDDLKLMQEEDSRSAYLIVIKGRAVGKMYKLDAATAFLGRASDVKVVIEDEGVSRRHARIEHKSGGFYVIDNNSTNGVFVNSDRIYTQKLEDGDRVQIGSNTILKFSYQDEVEENYQKQLYDSATRDGLTGAYNKKFFADRLKTEFAYCHRHDTLLSLILFDIDFFKKLNDGYGHPAGDYVLKNLSAVVEETLRTEDIFARYGGEEFGIILRDTNGELAFLIAERTRRAIEGFQFIYEEKRLPVQVSLGVATLEKKNYDSAKELVKASDSFLYKAKGAGRNRTESAIMG